MLALHNYIVKSIHYGQIFYKEQRTKVTEQNKRNKTTKEQLKKTYDSAERFSIVGQQIIYDTDGTQKQL